MFGTFYKTIILLILLSGAACSNSQNTSSNPEMIPVSKAWAGNSVNAVIFRHNSISTYKKTQYTAFYDNSGHVVVAKRTLPSHKWSVKRTKFTGNNKDAHNTISIMVDGNGILHMVWNQHNNQLHYVHSLEPGSLDFTDDLSMTGKVEDHVTYPEFYRLANGNLLFLYREGGSGNGNLVMNFYNVKTRKWSQIHQNLIDGQGQRNAYWQCAIGPNGYIYLSWVWRETPNVASNHDICYAFSKDNGKTWLRTDGKEYKLPITEATAEYARHIPQHSDLINQTSMTIDAQGHPYIATYWRPKDGVTPQYQLVYFDGKHWKVTQISNRKTPFNLEGYGSRHIPLSRPQILIHDHKLMMIYRDDERGDKVSVAINNDIRNNKSWKIRDLTDTSVGMWEPSYDIEHWKKDGILDLFVEKVVQKNSEGVAKVPEQMVKILDWKP